MKIARTAVFLLPLMMTLAVIPGWSQDFLESEFEKANQLYLDNDFTGAIEHYNSILQTGYSSGELHYNLGNAYFKSGKLGLSILHYEKAKKLLPRDEDLRKNLEMVRLRVADRIEVPRLALWEHVDRVRDYLTMKSLATLALLFYLLTLIAAAIYYFLPKGTLKKVTFLSAVLLLMVFILFGSVFGWRLWIEKNVKEAVILADKVEVVSAPDSGAQGLFSLHAGVKVQIIGEFEQWDQISLPDGKKGWLPKLAAGGI